MTSQTPRDLVFVLFGATGDLAKRKIIPGLFHLARAGLLPERYRIIGSSPSSEGVTAEGFLEHARAVADEFAAPKPTDRTWKPFARNLDYATSDVDDPSPLVDAVARAEKALGGSPQRLYHLAVPPVAFPSMVELLGASGLAKRARIIVEKPFGTDLASARKLNALIHGSFDESQVYRIDHFLGKESIDNILFLRFANGMFEPIWNRDHIDHVQIDVPETLSIEGRADFYDKTGAFRDMIVTHLLQVLGFVAMEPPVSLDADELHAERTKVFRAMRPIDPARVVRGQYRGYRREKGVPRGSDTETLAAVEVRVDNWRWAGVPFYLRSGKSMAESRQRLTLSFRRPPWSMFANAPAASAIPANALAIDFTDPGAIHADFVVKQPGAARAAEPARMRFSYADSFLIRNELEGYEHLIYEAMLGDRTLFTTADGVERLWEVSEPLLRKPPPVEPYAPGSWGPKSVDALLAPRRWHLPEAGT